MHTPTEITFHHLEKSAAVEAAVQRWVVRLEHVEDRITRCAATIDLSHRHPLLGRDFAVSVAVELAGAGLVASHATHPDIYVAVADAFRAARRQLLAHRGARTESSCLRVAP